VSLWLPSVWQDIRVCTPSLTSWTNVKFSKYIFVQAGVSRTTKIYLCAGLIQKKHENTADTRCVFSSARQNTELVIGEAQFAWTVICSLCLKASIQHFTVHMKSVCSFNVREMVVVWKERIKCPAAFKGIYNLSLRPFIIDAHTQYRTFSVTVRSTRHPTHGGF